MSGLSEVDIRDWIGKCDQVDKELDDCKCYERNVPYWFVDEVRDYFKSQQKQVAALFKPLGE